MSSAGKAATIECCEVWEALEKVFYF